MRKLKFVGKTEPPATKASAEVVQAAKDNQIVFAVIETETGRTIYTNIADEDARDLFDWLLSGVLQGVREDLAVPKATMQ